MAHPGRLQHLVRGYLVPVLLLAAAGPAAAEEPHERLELHWSAVAGCPSGPEVATAGARLLGGMAGPAVPALEVTAVVSDPQPGHWEVRLETVAAGEPRVRVVRGRSCAAVADAAAVILALMIDPAAVVDRPRSPASASTPSSRPVRPAPRPPASAPRVAADRAMARPARARPGLRLAGWASADVGSLPQVAAGGGASGALVMGRQRFEIAFEALPRSTARVSGHADAGGDLDLLLGWLGTCRSLTTGRLELAPCVAVELGRLHAAGFGVEQPSEATELWLAWRAGVAASWTVVGKWSLYVRVDAVGSLRRPRFVLLGVGPVHQPWRVAERTTLGVAYGF